jgi:DNA-binding NtrC family response regulator
MKTARILIVDDEPFIRSIVGQWLRSQGSDVTEVAGIPEADSSLASQGYDLIISDVHLSGNSRLQWTERLLGTENAPPVVLITGNPELETAMRAANLPISGYLVKPPNFNELGTLLQRTLTDRRQRLALRTLGRMVAGLIDDPAWAANDPRLRETMQHLGRCLATEGARPPRSAGSEPGSSPWRQAILETIVVLEKTKHSFHSRELGRLRQHLKQLLDRKEAA